MTTATIYPSQSAFTSPTNSQGGTAGFNVGTWGSPDDDPPKRGWLQFSMAGIPAGAIISSATCVLVSTGGMGPGGYDTVTITGALPSSTWSEAITDAGQPGVGATLGSVGIDTTSLSPGSSYSMGLSTSVIASWKASNTGIRLVSSEDGVGGFYGTGTAIVFYGRTGASPCYLSVVYTEAPTAPGAFTFPAAAGAYGGGTTLAVAWGNATDPDTATGSLTYQLDYSANGSSWTNLTTTGAGVTSYSWNTSGLAPGTTYYLRVRAYDGSNFGSYTQVGPFTLTGGMQMLV